MSDQPARLLLVDDHRMMRDSVADFLRAHGFRVCGGCGSAEEALAWLETQSPDLALVDASLPRRSGFDLVAELRRRGDDVPCLMLSGHRDRSYVRRAREAGASGYVLKGEPAELPGAIRTVLAGGFYVSAALQDEVGIG